MTKLENGSSMIPDSESEMVIHEEIEKEAKSIITDIMRGTSRYMDDSNAEWAGWYDYHYGRFRQLDNLVRALSRDRFHLDNLGTIREVTY